MKTLNFARHASLIALAACCAFENVQGENAAAVSEVLKLKNAGVAEDTIVAYVKGKDVNYDLSADNILTLRERGLPPAVLNAMLASGKILAADPAAPQPQPVVVQAQPVYAAPTVAPAPQPVPVHPVVVAQPAANPDVSYFYQELSPHGRWMVTEDGQWCWQPAIVATTPGWRPYWDKGHWVWTDQGWYWASDYAWGWAAFHYGRWNLHPHHGWIWTPDRVWGPAWVAWRSGGEYCGWAPLPPGAVYDLTGGRFIFRGRPVEASFDFGLGFAHFSFCFTKDMGSVLTRRFRNEPEMRAVFARTAIINRYTVHRTVVAGETRVQIFNHGIEPSHLPRVKGRSFEPVRIQEMRTPGPDRAHERLDPRSRTLEVYQPKFGGHH